MLNIYREMINKLDLYHAISIKQDINIFIQKRIRKSMEFVFSDKINLFYKLIFQD